MSYIIVKHLPLIAYNGTGLCEVAVLNVLRCDYARNLIETATIRLMMQPPFCKADVITSGFLFSE
ncbi:MAG: hypothetical protein ACKVPJ_01545 [Chitinophagales bacterium]